MSHKKIIAILILIQIIGSNSIYVDSNPNITQEPIKILFIGNSYFNYWDLPGLFENLTDNAEKDVYIDKYCKNGFSLYDQDNSVICEAKINQNSWDYVVLIGSGIETGYPEDYPNRLLLPTLISLREKIITNCNSTKMVFCLPWAFEDGHGWNDTYDSMQIEINEKTFEYLNEINYTISPIGLAWNTVLKDLHYPLHYLHDGDGNHPTRKGTYLMACVIFSTIFREPSTDITYYSDFTRLNAKYLQNVASDTVLNNIALWNIDPLPINDNPSIPGFISNSFLLFTLIGISIIIFNKRKLISKSFNK